MYIRAYTHAHTHTISSRVHAVQNGEKERNDTVGARTTPM